MLHLVRILPLLHKMYQEATSWESPSGGVRNEEDRAPTTGILRSCTKLLLMKSFVPQPGPSINLPP